MNPKRLEAQDMKSFWYSVAVKMTWIWKYWAG